MLTKEIVFSPFPRVEGDLLIKVVVADGQVVSSQAAGTLYRGFEAMLRGREVLEAIVFTSRVCGQCGLTHTAAAAAAIRALSGTVLPRNAGVAINVMLGVETVINHLTHFYLSILPDLTPPAAAAHPLLDSGRSPTRVLGAREELIGVLGLFAGKWPNSLAIQPGGTTRPLAANELRRAHGLLAAVEERLEAQFTRCRLDEWLALGTAADLDRWLGEGDHAGSDLGRFLAWFRARGGERIGAWPARFLSSGGWPDATGQPWHQPGFLAGEWQAFDPARIVEHVACSWYEGPATGRPPADGETEPAPDRAGAYSWAKAPRYAGQPAETGPLARLAIGGDPLVTDLLRCYGPSAMVRELARLHELIRLLGRLKEWFSEIDPEEPFCAPVPSDLDGGCGLGLVEAPRGLLGHWVRVQHGCIRNYQIVTPTGWNLSPRDANDVPGPLETALVGVPVPDPDAPTALAQVVKSFDPCLFCTVH